VERLIRIYGRESDVVRVRVFGLPPRQDATAVVGLGDVQTARARGARLGPVGRILDARGEVVEADAGGLAELLREELRDGAVFGGLDVARSGDDDCALVTFRASRCVAIDFWRDAGIDVTTARAARWLDENESGVLLVDVSGMGAGVYDFLAAMYGARVVGVDFGGSPVLGELRTSDETGDASPKYLNRRTELYYTAATWLRDRGEIDERIDAEILERLEEDLTAPRGGLNGKGAFQMEEKKRTKERLGRSPDFGDAFVLGVAGILGGCEVAVSTGSQAERREKKAGRARDLRGNRWSRTREFGGR
jgi:hypothetical protein